MSNNKELTAPITIPAELHSTQIATFLTGLSAWNQEHAQTLEELYWGYCRDTGSKASVPGRIDFSSFMFLDCRTGIELRERLQTERKAHVPTSPRAKIRQPAPSTRDGNN
jgi:hypothetical protein